jgi:hypothetical protein
MGLNIIEIEEDRKVEEQISTYFSFFKVEGMHIVIVEMT